MPSVYLLRHCEYDNPRNILPGRLPVELSEAGKEQARKLGQYFADKNITWIYSSAVMRCKQTAELIANTQIQIIYDKRLLETLSAYQGYWEENRHPGGYHFFSHRDELGGESLADMQLRMIEFWQEISKDLKDNIIICGHGDPLQTLYAHIFNLPLVDDKTPEDEIPGWIQKGGFIELTLQDGKATAGKPQLL